MGNTFRKRREFKKKFLDNGIFIKSHIKYAIDDLPWTSGVYLYSPTKRIPHTHLVILVNNTETRSNRELKAEIDSLFGEGSSQFFDFRCEENARFSCYKF